MEVRVIGLCNVGLLMWASEYSRYKSLTVTLQVIYYPTKKFVSASCSDPLIVFTFHSHGLC